MTADLIDKQNTAGGKTEPIRLSKHRRIFEDLRQEITSGRYAESQRLPSESQIVSRFGVSRPTATRALRDLQNAGLIERRAGGRMSLP